MTSRDIADAADAQGVKLARGQVELDKPIKSLGAHKIKVHLHPEVTVEITALVGRSPDEAEFLAKGGTLVAETERAQLEAAEAARRAAEQAAALFEAKSAAAKPAEGETDADMARGHTQVFLDLLKGEGFAQPNPRPMFPNPPGLLRLEPYSPGLRDRIWWGAGSSATESVPASWTSQSSDRGRQMAAKSRSND